MNFFNFCLHILLSIACLPDFYHMHQDGDWSNWKLMHKKNYINNSHETEKCDYFLLFSKKSTFINFISI